MTTLWLPSASETTLNIMGKLIILIHQEVMIKPQAKT